MVHMVLRALLITIGLSFATFAPASAKDTRPQWDNPNVKHAMKKAKKVRPGKYKAPKRSKKPARARYGVKRA